MKHKLVWKIDLVKSTKTQTLFIQIILSFLFFLYSGSTFCIFVVTQLVVNCKKILSI